MSKKKTTAEDSKEAIDIIEKLKNIHRVSFKDLALTHKINSCSFTLWKRGICSKISLALLRMILRQEEDRVREKVEKWNTSNSKGE